MAVNLDKCTGCHTCSITCKNVRTNRPGAEYMYFNNVETKPRIGYPKYWEDQEKWKGGWKLEGNDLVLASGSKLERIYARQDVNFKNMSQEIKLEFEDLFMKYLPRNCNHCLNPACVAALHSRMLLQKNLLQLELEQGREVHLLFPAS